ncbi:hypothetical protein HAX54_006907, partial [Datura stramonium]|nr:hypothetical protein [Datura stramonium]
MVRTHVGVREEAPQPVMEGGARDRDGLEDDAEAMGEDLPLPKARPRLLFRLQEAMHLEVHKGVAAE